MDLLAATRAVMPDAASARGQRYGPMTVITLELPGRGSFELPLAPCVTLLIASGGRARVLVAGHEEVLVGTGVTCAVAARTGAGYVWSRAHRLRLFFVESSAVRLSGLLGVARDEVARHVSAALAAVVSEDEHPSQAVTALALVHALDARFAETRRRSVEPAAFLGPEMLRKVETFVGQNLDQDITIQAMARVVGASRAHFARQFRESTGMTPMTYVTRARIERAKELLAGGARGATIAVTVGFCDQSHFNRVFKREVGVTPRSFVIASAPSAPRRGARSP